MMPELLKLFGLGAVGAVMFWAIGYFVQWSMGWI
jgi:hypothetical protein